MNDAPKDSRLSLSVEISKEASEKVIDAVSDIFSPASEFLGALGDRIRIFRAKSAMKVLEEAQRLAKKNGLKFKTPPLKFLVPFLEKASLEDDASDLTARWAKLLVSASTEFNEQLLVFSDVISQIGPVGAQTIKYLGERVDPEESDWVGLRFQLEDFHSDISGWFYRFVQRDQNFPGIDFRSDEFNELFDKKPVVITDFGLPDRKFPHLSMFTELEYTSGFDFQSTLALERIGLLRRGQFESSISIRNNKYIVDEQKGEFPFSVGYATLTPFGFQFYRCCEQEPEERKSSSEQEVDKRKERKRGPATRGATKRA